MNYDFVGLDTEDLMSEYEYAGKRAEAETDEDQRSIWRDYRQDVLEVMVRRGVRPNL